MSGTSKRKVGAIFSSSSASSSSFSGGSSHHRKRNKKSKSHSSRDQLSEVQRDMLKQQLTHPDTIFELKTTMLVCQNKLYFGHVEIQKSLENSYQSLASQATILCDWQNTLRFEKSTQEEGAQGQDTSGGSGSGSGGGGGTGSDASGTMTTSTAATAATGSSGGSGDLDATPTTIQAEGEDEAAFFKRLLEDKGTAKPMIEHLLKRLHTHILTSCDEEACVQLLETSACAPKFIEQMIVDPVWRETLFELVRRYRTTKNAFFEYVLARISALSEKLHFNVPAELCVDADSQIFRNKLTSEIEKVPHCRSLEDFQRIRRTLKTFNNKFYSHFFTVTMLTSKCGGSEQLGTPVMYQDRVKCLYFRLLQDVRRDALDRLVVEAMMDRYTQLSGLPQEIATLFVLGRSLRQRDGKGQYRADMAKVKELVTAVSSEGKEALTNGAGAGEVSEAQLRLFDVALQIRQSGVMTDIISVLCDPFEKDDKLLDNGNRQTLCQVGGLWARGRGHGSHPCMSGWHVFLKYVMVCHCQPTPGMCNRLVLAGHRECQRTSGTGA